MAKNFDKILNQGDYSGAGIGADNNKFNIYRGAERKADPQIYMNNVSFPGGSGYRDTESGHDQQRQQYIYVNIGDFAGAGVGATSNRFGGPRSSTNEDPHQIIKNAEIPDPDNSLPIYTGEAIWLVQSTVMFGQLIPYSNQTAKPDTFVVFSRNGVNFKWDRDPGNWLYLGVQYVGGGMDGNYGFCFYSGAAAQAKVHIDGWYKQVEIPFYPTNLASKEKNQGIYYLEGSGYVWGWLYNASPISAGNPTPTPNPKSDSAVYGPRLKPNSFDPRQPSSSTDFGVIKGNRYEYIPNSSHKPKPGDYTNIIKAMAIPTKPLPKNVKRVGSPSYGLVHCIISGTFIPTIDQPEKPHTFVTFRSSAWDNNDWFHLVVEYHNHLGIFIRKCGLCFYDGRRERAPKFNNVNEPCYVPFLDKMATNENDQGFYLLKGRGYVWGFIYTTANNYIQSSSSTYEDRRPVSRGGHGGYSSDNYGRDKDKYARSSDDDTNYGDDDGLISDEDTIDNDLGNLLLE